MTANPVKISACLVVYNEEKIIEQCLRSIKDLADEIILVHDGECSDNTLEIAKKYTDKIFVRDHVGIMEAHLVFAFEKASGEWLLRIDADEYFDAKDLPAIKQEIADPTLGGVIFKWELWDGQKPVYFKGLEKLCLMRKSDYHFFGIPHEAGVVDKKVARIDVTLHHRPPYNNIAWNSFFKKRKKWVPIHAKYFFPEMCRYDSFNTQPVEWIKHAKKVRKNIVFYIVFEPLKMLMGQLKNGLIFSLVGVQVAAQQYVYYLSLYWKIWQMEQKLK